MQLHISLAASSFVLPINYRPLLHGQIYRAMADDPEYSARLHGLNPDGVNSRPFKGFTFSPLRGSYTVNGNTIRFLQQAFLEIRSVDPALIHLLCRHFSRAGSMILGTEKIAVSACEITDGHLHTDRAAIRMISPAVAYITDESRHTAYFRPDDERFYAALLRNAERKNSAFQPRVPFRLSIRSLNGGLPRKQFSRFKKTYITGWFGRYLLEGSPDVIDLLYQAGLGAKNSEGYGLFAADDPPDGK